MNEPVWLKRADWVMGAEKEEEAPQEGGTFLEGT